METFVYTIPYIPKDESYAALLVVRSTKERTLPEVLQQFFIDVQHRYEDDDFVDFTIDELLQIAVEEYRIDGIQIEQRRQNKPDLSGVFSVRSIYQRRKYQEEILSHLSQQNEILLSTMVSYDELIESDEIRTSIDGVETFLFSFRLHKDTPFHYISDKWNYESYEFEPGVDVPTDFIIENPLRNEEDIIQVFRDWSKSVGLELEGKTIRIANDEDFTSRPYIEDLEDSINHVDKQFYLPNEIAEWVFKGRPSVEEQIKVLRGQPPGVIACAIYNLRDETIQKILNSFPKETQQRVIELMPRIPSLSLEERKRFVNMFDYHSEFIIERMNDLNKKYHGDVLALTITKEHLKNSEQDDLGEYQAWLELRLSKKIGDKL